MKINRLFEIVYILLQKKKVTSNELAKHFEVSKRTILRDIDVLASAGIPIYTSKGKGGGIFILEHFVLDKTMLSEEEQQQILFALQSFAATQHINTQNISSKLIALFQTTQTNWIEVDFSRWGSEESDKEKFNQLKHAILHQKNISFTYFNSYGEQTERTISPLQLLFKSKSWYSFGYCLSKNEYRLFKVNRMLHIHILDASFARQQFSSPLVETTTQSSQDLVDLQLLFTKNVAHRIYDEFDPTHVKKKSDGTFGVTVQLPNDDWLIGFLLSFGTSVQVLSPESVKCELRKQIDNMKNFYSL